VTRPRLLSLKEAAETLGLTWPSGSLRSQIKAGKLKAKKIGPRDWFVTEQAIEDYRREHLSQRVGWPKGKKRKAETQNPSKDNEPRPPGV
jgi:hypothetical protein